ncbi:MAG TPA: RNA-binding cell elongation regulator Jag/EloR [Tetragenococcus sp.]|nr:RNA-binding cell elongation regulator Jag/EloR [Tetragenococcus sp.]
MPIYEGATVDEAIQKALTSLAADRSEVTVDIITEGKKGFLGVGKKNAKVSLELISKEKDTLVETNDTKEAVQERPVTPESESKETTEPSAISELENLEDQEALTQLGIYLTNITNQLNAPAMVKMSYEEDRIIFNLETKKQGLLIGRHGKTLNALQYLAQVFIHRVAKNKLSIMLNVGDYRQKRSEILQRLAEKTAEKVDRTGHPVFLEPMPAFERKQIHAALSKKDYVSTHSEGDEPYRYLVVEPAKKYY